MSNTQSINMVDGLGPNSERASSDAATQSTSTGNVLPRLTSVSIREDTTLREILNAAESEAILRALQHTGWNRKRAAALLKISYRGLLYKIRSHSITRPVAGD